MAPINVETVHQTSLFHIESNFDWLELLSPTHDQRSHQQSGQITLQPALINQAQVSQGHTSYRNKECWNTEVHSGGGLELVKPAREPASSRPKSCAFLEKPHESSPFAAYCRPLQEENRPWSEISFSLRNLPVRAFDSRAQGFSTPPASRRSSCPPPSPDRTHPIEHYQALCDSAPCLSRTATSRRTPNWSSEEART